jgi:hypothetical protein
MRTILLFFPLPLPIVAAPYVLSANWAGKYHMGWVPDTPRHLSS